MIVYKIIDWIQLEIPDSSKKLICKSKIPTNMGFLNEIIVEKIQKRYIILTREEKTAREKVHVVKSFYD